MLESGQPVLRERVLMRLDEMLLRLVRKTGCYLRSMSGTMRLVMGSYGKVQRGSSQSQRNVEGRAEVVVKDSDTGALLHIA